MTSEIFSAFQSLRYTMAFLLFTLLVLPSFVVGDGCPTNNLGKGVCAKLYDDDDCDGWGYDVEVGYKALPFLKKNDAETVVVQKGCVLAAFDHAADSISERGRRVVFDATGRNTNLVKNLRGSAELEEEISSVECRCLTNGGGSSNNGRRGSRPRTGNSGANCDNLQFPGNSACIVYDDEDCQVEDWDEPLFFNPGQQKSFSLSKGLGNFKYKNTIESVSVRRGCTLEVFDDSDFSDDGYAFIAPPTEDLHATLDRSIWTRSLDDDIESLKCFCD